MRKLTETHDRIAALLERDVEPDAIAKRLGINRKGVYARMSEIRKALGRQAV